MQLEQLAHRILFGDRWEDKLANSQSIPDRLDDNLRGAALEHAPRFPGRPPRLARIGKAEFPKLDQLALDSTRGQILHFFANHELLAMELMALMLLKFPEAPADFRAGIARTIFEEQEHLKLYVERMRELGVDFGDLPVSDYFWNAMKDMKSPLEFVTQMSLTLEQANLDFSLFYQQATARVGDEKTAAILERVYREEIGHVKHGLVWFNRWRESPSQNESESDWDAYLRLLPPPMTPRRAKGTTFSVECRRQAGFSETFIRELEVYGGSKGRPPVLWIYNPLCDAEIARGKPGLSPAEPVRRLNLDLEALPMYLASEQDVVLVQELPRAEWLKSMSEIGIRAPEFRRAGRAGETPRETKLGGFEPWGWSPETFERFRPWRDRLTFTPGANAPWCTKILEQETFAQTQLGEFFSKTWSTRFLRQWLEKHSGDAEVFGAREHVGQIFRDWSSAREHLTHALQEGQIILAKAPWGTSGTQNKRVREAHEIDGNIGGWIRNTIEAQGAIVLEPWLDKIADLSMQIEVRENEVRIVGIRQFLTGSRLEYLGTYLDAKLNTLPTEARRWIHSEQAPLERWHQLARALGAELRERGYQGPAGLDAMLYRSGNGEIRLRPLVELNPRWTMGRVAIELEKHVLPGTLAAWIFFPLRDTSEKIRQLLEKHPPQLKKSGDGFRLAQGIIATNDPERAREVLTLLVAGDAIQEVLECR